MKIQVLSQEAINQIAAGEVIESPASVVKELVENSIDAGATKITIEVRAGGLALVAVSDDGVGMSKEDALLSIERHATSKIVSAKDLFALHTMGFRGEALAAIAAISHMTLITAEEGKAGTQLEIEGGAIKKVQSCARLKGTRIEVRDLFFNVPARKKFQKSPPALFAEIVRISTLLALSYPEIEFELQNGGKTVFRSGRATLQERARSLIGEDFVQAGFSVEEEISSFRLSGLVGDPAQSRPNRLGQYLFINRRAVVCPALNFAIREAYGTRLEERRFPSYLLHMTIPPDLVDVNVHPQKREVRLRDERVFQERVREVVSRALIAPPAPVISMAPFTPMPVFEPPVFRAQETAAFMPLPFEQEEERVIGLFAHYLILEEEGLLLVDLKAARFRLAFDKLMEKETRGVEKQGLLIPMTVECNPVEMAMILSHLEAIEALGFSLRPIGKEHLIVEAIPPFLEFGEIKELLAESSQALQGLIGKSDAKEKRHEALALIAARFAKNGPPFNVEEAVRLFRAVRKRALHCPNGKPIMARMSRDEIKKMFS